MGNVTEIRDYLNAQFFEREAEVDAMLTAVLARQHTLLIGPAGTGKSALASELHRCIDGLGYFQWLLTKFSTTEEIFGPLSLARLEEDLCDRNVEGKLPTVHLAFLDEIFKSNNAILNALLTMINERILSRRIRFVLENQIPLCEAKRRSNAIHMITSKKMGGLLMTRKIEIASNEQKRLEQR